MVSHPPSLVHPSYLHKNNRDGTYDSICLRCFRTVGSANNVVGLVPAETYHVCDAIVVARRVSHLMKASETN
jgi:hypothetical protein